MAETYLSDLQLAGRYGVHRTTPWGWAKTETLALVGQVRAVLDEYADHLPLTVRQVFYRLVGTVGFDKTERAYSRLCETIGRARRAGLLPFTAFRDDGGSRHGGDGWDSPAAFLRGLRWQAEGFTLDRQQGQPVRLWLLCEAAGMWTNCWPPHGWTGPKSTLR